MRQRLTWFWYRIRLARLGRLQAHNALVYTAGYQDGAASAYEAGVTEGYRCGLIAREGKAN